MLDIAIANNYWGDQNQIYINTGGLNFNLLGYYGDYITSRGVAWGDYDNNGLLDVAIANDNGVNNKLDVQISPGVFALLDRFGAYHSFGVSWADYDNDCDLDVAVTNAFNEPNILYENIGSTNFQEHRVFGYGNPRDGTWGDYDNDGLPDFAVAMREGGIAIYHNDGGGSFSVGYSSGTPMVVGLNWGDFEYDGDLDLVAATLDNSNVYIFRNNNGSFEQVQVAYKYRNSGVAWFDFDLDGDLDIVAGSYTDYELLSVYENQGDTAFTSHTISSGYLCIISLAIGDMDNDGDVDICASAYWNDLQNKLFRNDLDASNYIKVYLRGRAIPGYSNYYGVGAKIKVYDSNDSLVRYHEMCGGMGRSMNAMEAIFGVSLSDTYMVIAEWPASGIVDSVTNVTAPEVLTIYEGQGTGIEREQTSEKPNSFSIYPNPGKEQFHIYYTIDKTENVSLKVYDISGRLVRNINKGSQNPGIYSFTWNGKDNDGIQLRAGVYFILLERTSKKSLKKVVILK